MDTISRPDTASQRQPIDEPLAAAGEIVDLRPLGADFDIDQNLLLVKTKNVRILQQFIAAGQTIPTHEAPGEIVIHCLGGRATLTALGKAHQLSTGQLLYLSLNEPFSIRGIEHTALLVTIVAAKSGSNVELIGE